MSINRPTHILSMPPRMHNYRHAQTWHALAKPLDVHRCKMHVCVCVCVSQAMYTMLQEYGGKILPADQVALDDTREVRTPYV